MRNGNGAAPAAEIGEETTKLHSARMEHQEARAQLRMVIQEIQDKGEASGRCEMGPAELVEAVEEVVRLHGDGCDACGRLRAILGL